METLARYRDRIAFALLLAASLALLWADARRGAPSWMDRAAMVVVGPLARAGVAVRDGAGSLWGSYVALRGAHEEAKELRARVDVLEAERIKLKLAAEEADRLRALLGLREHVGLDVVPARVVGRERNGAWHVLKISIAAGEAEGVEPGMPVVTPDGVAGTIAAVYGSTADVLLLTDPDSALDVLVGKGRAGGTLRGAGIEGEYLAVVDYVSRAEPITAGDLVVTSGLAGILPKGLAVGKVVRAEAPPDKLFYQVTVAPAVDIATVEEVLVVKTAPSDRALAEAVRSAGGGPAPKAPTRVLK
ncbi:MAG TPA: rod shape-determining protein MreC [Myxococcota bacterium]|jgi:rod shape-determining protein MreC|nr:rod shape-determining protein MreC [Myxococcota bacterium]